MYTRTLKSLWKFSIRSNVQSQQKVFGLKSNTVFAQNKCPLFTLTCAAGLKFTSISESLRSFTTSHPVLKKKKQKINHYNEDCEDEVSEELNIDTDSHVFKDDYLLPQSGHRVLVIQPDPKRISHRPKSLTTPQHQLDEACALVESLAGWNVANKMIKNIKSFSSKELFGKGTFEVLTKEIRQGRYNNTAVFIGTEMMTSEQMVRLQDAWGLPVYDRFTIVLQIFKTRARTKEAKLQVALAEVPYYRSRLRHLHSGNIDQGAASYIGGSGETYLEMRRRLLQEREIKLKKALEKVQSQRQLLRKARIKRQSPVIAVVGYTNAGKTSLIKALTQDQSMEPLDKLFATLDVTVHAGLLSNRLKVLYVDTVGFISDIPTSLIASFSATLEDVKHADLLVHVRDISHPDTYAQKKNVFETLASLELPASLTDNIIEVCNKVDLVDISTLGELVDENCIGISATSGVGLQQLTDKIQETVICKSGRVCKCMKIPMNGDHLSWLYKEATIESTRSCDENNEFLLVDVIMTDSAYAKFISRFGAPKIGVAEADNGC